MCKPALVALFSKQRKSHAEQLFAVAAADRSQCTHRQMAKRFGNAFLGM
jgi:hypothetical protein